MDKMSLDGKQSSKEFTEVISRNIRAGHERDYDDWLRRFMISERQFPGYLGTTVIAPGDNVSSVRYIINRFANQASLDAWENSEESLKLLEEVSKYSTSQRITGMETWCSLSNLKTIGAPPRWKMAIVSFIGVYSISLLAQYILGLYLGQSPLLTNILMTIILVVGLTYFAMPLLSRLLRRWLYPRNV
ncbi:MAG: antibiotic biosynthesis monooxygenase [Candidatus Nitrosopolaris sp.]